MVGIREEDAEYRLRWGNVIGCGDQREKKKKKSCAHKSIPVMMARTYDVSPVQHVPAVISV